MAACPSPRSLLARGPRECRPLRWDIAGPYVTLYLAAQMFLGWPLWDVWRPGWAVYLGLFAVNTALNIADHAAPER